MACPTHPYNKNCESEPNNPRKCVYGEHNVRCAIKWADIYGRLTPDDSDAIGIVHREAYTETEPVTGQIYDLPRSENFPICAFHARRLSDLGMEHWHFENLCCAEFAMGNGEHCADCPSERGAS